jgi:hypothetical protein
MDPSSKCSKPVTRFRLRICPLGSREYVKGRLAKVYVHYLRVGAVTPGETLTLIQIRVRGGGEGRGREKEENERGTHQQGATALDRQETFGINKTKQQGHDFTAA